MDFYDKYIKLCTESGKSGPEVAVELGFHRTAPSNWKKRQTTPTPANLKKIADYFGVPISYFEDEAEEEKRLFALIDTHEKKLLELYRALDVVDQAKLLVYASELMKK